MVGKRPLQGTKLFVKMAMRRSLGESTITAAGYAYSVAAKAHKHGKSLFAAGLAAGKTAVHIKSSPGAGSRNLPKA